MDNDEATSAENSQPDFESSQRIILSGRDFARFVALIDHPKPPTQELREAMADYDRLRAENPDAGL